MRKGKDPELDPDLYLWLMDPDPGGKKHVDPADPDPQPLLSGQLAFPLSLPERDSATRPIFRYFLIQNRSTYGPCVKPHFLAKK
jgi:hypothetical protein